MLHDARQTNAGQRLTRPADLAAWLGTALALRPGVAMRAESKAGRIAVSLSGKGVDYALLEEVRAALRRLGRG